MGFDAELELCRGRVERARSVALILPGLASARDTVDGLTPASSATS